MKKASKLFQGLVTKSKQIFSTKKDEAIVDNGFNSGEDNDLIEIGKHKGAVVGAKSAF